MSVRRRVAALAVCVLLFGGLLAALWIVPLLKQEPASTFVQAIKLQISSDEVLPLPNDEQAWIVRTGNFDTVIELMGEHGFAYVDQLGAAHIFEDEGEQIVVVCRQYTTRFQVCDQ